MTQDYINRTVWIIGASSGIGEALARELSDRGARLLLSARSEDTLRALAHALPQAADVLPFDVADLKATKQAADNAWHRAARIDAVVVLAAIYKPMHVNDFDMDFVHKLITVNLIGTFNVVHAVLPPLKKQGGGQLALTGSIAGYRGLPEGQPYSATKAGITNLAETLKLETRNENIDVRLISPGFVKTPMTDKNDFAMPAIITPEKAAQAIANGLRGSSYEIHFPKRFTYALKFLRILPNRLYFWLMGRM